MQPQQILHHLQAQFVQRANMEAVAREIGELSVSQRAEGEAEAEPGADTNDTAETA